ncbi:sensor histidine kinase [Leifsonia sp. A12D58]|uniref:sensor histidine kinase n=1 Tax=Leifsonia sp. A12D58 TaxID=3397674 RepID=UPI0039E05D06
MTTKRWWDLAVGVGLVVMALVAVFGYAASPANRIGAVATLAAIGLCYALWGRRRPGSDRPSVVFCVVISIGCGVATFFVPNMATLQAFVFPLIWVLSGSAAAGIALSVFFATSIAVGFALGLGGSAAVIQQAIAIEGISLVFAISIGLWISRIISDGEKHRTLLTELTAAQGELAAMHRDAGSASERERLAREIHDTIAQSLTSLVMLAQRTKSELAAAGAEATPAAETVDLIEDTARDALTEARALVAAMSSASVGDSTLTEALHRLAERFERETGIQVDMTVAAHELDREIEVVLLRCTQEGLANVRKHSRAEAASVSIVLAGDNDSTGKSVTLTVLDNGRGLGAYSPVTATGFGLSGMRDRVGLVGGDLRVGAGTAGTGTELRIKIPVGEPS